ncbi:alanine--tRNA ligase [Patescibacteria group bacterium]|nr:alanine--tRNA ligase [Patescibacteria group bacterium]MBU1500912.1 alanine--tRNA ligase [Patescibacteria group bacterium]MBU2080967.1 alanine--tRNA ligase [Patescibacteria group bacterium]MBU2124072.1 alanine--tRNA ligase [Patescibacteria group bacterium]MBU2194637.1 alanine--tRNA ligase [Patescibacteria group bacterium]
MTLSEVRSRFLTFYKARGHVEIPSAPIRPDNDPTTLFTSSGMQPLVPYLLGEEHPAGTRLVDAQTCFRGQDIEEVGDNRHTTFFEMLGNWSLGDYFREEQLPWVFEFLTSKEEGLGLDPEKLYVTVFSGDESTGIGADMESVALWQKLFEEKSIEAKFSSIGSEEEGYKKGMQGSRIFAYDAKKNWWSRAGVPNNMPPGEPGGPDSELFYDFGLPHDPSWGAECHPNCDCGRFVEIGNSVFMQFKKEEDGSFSQLPKKNVDFGGGLERLVAATLGDPDVFLIDVFEKARRVLEEKTGKTYGATEEDLRSFRIILDHTRAAFFMLASDIKPSNTEAGYILRRLLRRAIREVDRLGIKDAVLVEIAHGFAELYKDQYPWVADALPLIEEGLSAEERKFRNTLTTGLKEFEKLAAKGDITGENAFILFSSFGFPFELTQELAKERGLTLLETDFKSAMEAHQSQSRAGAAQKFAGGLADHAEQTVRYHTTHHILLKALQMVLGEEVFQRGSNITSERLRIDFSSPGKMSDEQKAEVERIVNDIIYQDLPVTRTVMPREEAEKLGAQMEFGVKYPDTVSVYSVGPAEASAENPRIPEAFSLEFCGGPHVANTSEIHTGGTRFKILKEEAVASGIRRIKAVLV